MDEEMRALLAEADDFLGESGPAEEVEMVEEEEEEEEEGSWEMIDRVGEVIAVDSADNSPGSSLDLQLGEDDLIADDEGEERAEDEEGEEGRRQVLERISQESDSSVAMTIRIGLKEPVKDADRFRHLVTVLGAEAATAAYAATLRQEEGGGMLSAQGQRRTPGGAFFELLKDFATEEQMRAIQKFRKDKQKMSARNKVVEQVAKAGGLRPQGQKRAPSSTPGARSPVGGGGIKKKRDARSGRSGRQPRAPNRQRSDEQSNRRHSVQGTPRAQTAPRAQQDALVI